MPGFVELHCHSAYSFLDGASLPEELVQTAAEQGYDALALTDHDGVFGAMEFAQAAAAVPNFRAIHGTEITVRVDPRGPELPAADAEPDPETRRHLTLLVQDARGWRSLCRLLTRAHRHTRDHPRRVRTAPWVTIADVCDLHEGLVCLSGCADHGVEEEVTLKTLREAFGTEDLYVERQRRYLRGDREQGRRRTELARRLGLRSVATGNVHAHSYERAKLQDALVAIRRHATLDASEPLRRGNHSHVMVPPKAMVARFADDPDAVAESVRLADRLRFDLTKDLGYSYPGQEDDDAPRKLAEVCRQRFVERYEHDAGDAPLEIHGRRTTLRREARGRLDEELRLIGKLGLSGFFHLHYEILELAREVALEVRGRGTASALMPPGRGRGSSVSSIVCYLTGLSHVDPVASHLSIGRFLHEELDTSATLPDIDLDFPRDVREVLIPRVHEKYGDEKAALVATFPTYRARGSIRELGGALGLPAAELERVARGSEGWSGSAVADDIASALRIRAGHAAGNHEGQRTRTERDAMMRAVEADPDDVGAGLPGRWAWLARLSAMAHGLPRHLSQHPGGMIIATRPLIDCCPVVPSAMAGRQMVMWDKDSCSDAGFAKIDLLGLGMLSCVARTVDLISERRGEVVDLSRIPLDDEATFGAIQRAETTGVFQIESRAQMGSLLRTQPETLEEITIQVAIVRPGPIQGGGVNPYIERRQGLREAERQGRSFEIPYLHPSLKGALEPTLGTILFQDQVIEVSRDFAGFGPSKAEAVRRAMSRKRSTEEMEKSHEDFVQGAIDAHARTSHPVDRALAEQVWGMVSGFAGFGFPKAHAVAFGLLAYQSTWLRVHYGPEFLCSLLDEQPMGFYPPDALIHEAQRRGITVLPPDVRTSNTLCRITDDGAILVGLGYVKGIRQDEIDALVAEREQHGPWRSLTDLPARLGSALTSLEALAWAGACDGLAAEEGIPEAKRRRAAMWRVGAVSPGRRVAAGTQMALGLEAGAEPELAPMTPWERLIADYDSTAITAGPHPLELLRPQLQRQRAATSADLPRLRHGSAVAVGGMVLARQRPGSAKGIVFLLLEDEHGTINLIVSPNVYAQHRLAVRTEPLVVAEGRLERHAAAGGQINVVVRRLSPLDEYVDRPSHAEVTRLQRLNPEELERWRQEQAATGLVAVGGGVAPGGGGPGAGGGGSGRPGRGGGPPGGGEGRPGRGDRGGVEGGGFRAVAPEAMNFGRGRGR